MKEGATFFVGEHNFSAFSASRGGEEKEDSKIRKVWKMDVFEEGVEVHFLVEGSGFLYKMVRSMVGALLDVGVGKIEPNEILDILNSKLRTERVVSAPAKRSMLGGSFLSGKCFVSMRFLRAIFDECMDVFFPVIVQFARDRLKWKMDTTPVLLA